MKTFHRQFETNESNYIMIGFGYIRKNIPTMNSDSIKEMFPDWAEIEPGNWSKFGKFLKYGSGRYDVLEIGLYREPIEELGRVATDEEAECGIYDGRYTLQIFNGDDVIFCADVNDARGLI